VRAVASRWRQPSIWFDRRINLSETRNDDDSLVRQDLVDPLIRTNSLGTIHDALERGAIQQENFEALIDILPDRR
jgi:hypothetical protein